ncbi:MAG: CO dehydrogenase/CO-methylating acetyl-CoA synthase complex subunit beta [Chloroflexi bacterium]|nr:CO dehydrogenase/CO-methylating acetyl-CoA synthase complex subunit beta [Chloroflexota bacterium]
MSRFIATSAIRGANQIVAQAEGMYQKALKELGPETPIAFTNTAYFLPVIYGFTGHKVQKLADLAVPLDYARGLLSPVPKQSVWLPYLGEALDSGVATLFAEEAIEGIRFARGEQPEVKNGYTFNGPIDDVQMRAWGVALVDGRMPGFAAIVGAAKSNEVAVKIFRELQARGLLVFLCSDVNGRTITDQLLESGVELGYGTYSVPFGSDTISAVYALGFATRAAFSFGNFKPGNYRDILFYNKFRCFAFGLALGQVDDLKYATAAGVINYGFPIIADTVIPNVLPTGVTEHEHVVSLPFDDIPGKDDLERAERLVQRCVEIRGIRIKIKAVEIPVAYGAAFEGEIVRRNQIHAEFGGKGGTCFELLTTRKADQVEDGKVTVVGPDIDSITPGANIPLGILVEVAGAKMDKDFEPVIERQFHHFVNMAEGLQHIGQRDIAWIRVSKTAFEKGFRLQHFGKILHAKVHEDFGALVDKVQVTIFADPAQVKARREAAQVVYRERNQRLMGLKDEAVDVFYSCSLCQSFAPTHICAIPPERSGLCGAYSWLDCKAAYQINPRGPNQPIAKGQVIDQAKGEFEGINEFVFNNTQRSVQRVTLYSVMDAPMTSCGCFECIMVVIPEANGFMVVSREDPSMTPCGMTFSTLAGTAGGGLQNPGVMGHGKMFVISEKFLKADGGLKRVVWMSSNLKEELGEQLKDAAAREGEPDLLDKIADEKVATSVEDLLPFLQERGHPALTMDSLLG